MRSPVVEPALGAAAGPGHSIPDAIFWLLVTGAVLVAAVALKVLLGIADRGTGLWRKRQSVRAAKNKKTVRPGPPPVTDPMSKDVYRFDICRAGRAADRHRLTGDIREEARPDQAEKDELYELIRLKFRRLNRAAGPDPAARRQNRPAAGKTRQPLIAKRKFPCLPPLSK